MPGDGPWAAYGGQDEQGPWAKYAGKPGATTANNSVENAAPKLEGSALERGVSGAISGAKALLPDVNPGHILSNAVDMASGAAVPKAIGGAYQTYQENRKIGQGVIPSAASAIGSMVGLDSPGIRDRALQGDVAGVVGESVPAIAGTLIGGEIPRARAMIGERMYTPAGELTPGASAITHPTQLPEYIGRKLFPEPEAQVARREMETGYEQKGSDLMRRGREQDVLDRRTTQESRRTAKEADLAQQPMRKFMEGGSGPMNLLSQSPNLERVPKIGASGAGQPLLGGGEFSPDDLISRTRALVRPGEQPSPADLKRAGDLTQAPLGRLQALAKWGDELAKNEINRRLQNP